jgi:polysaccharide biosynthesis/export protein
MALRRIFLSLVGLLLFQPCFAAGQQPSAAAMPQAGGGSRSTEPSLSIGGLSDGPIEAGEVVHINVFDAPDFSVTTRVSESGDVPIPIFGPFHIAGLNSASAAQALTEELKNRRLMLDPIITITVDSSRTGITLLGEVRNPGIYPPPGKHRLSDLLASAGGMTVNTGRIIEITNDQNPGKKDYVAWDPTMHNTENFDRPVAAGDRVLVRACGIAYVGGNVVKPGAYSLCGSPNMTLSKVMALAGGTAPNTNYSHTYLVRAQPDGTRVVQQIDVKKVLTSRVADPIIHEDDIIYVSPSPIKAILKNAVAFAVTLTPTFLYLFY